MGSPCFAGFVAAASFFAPTASWATFCFFAADWIPIFSVGTAAAAAAADGSSSVCAFRFFRSSKDARLIASSTW
jgi:hypothetical protein